MRPLQLLVKGICGVHEQIVKIVRQAGAEVIFTCRVK